MLSVSPRHARLRENLRRCTQDCRSSGLERSVSGDHRPSPSRATSVRQQARVTLNRRSARAQHSRCRIAGDAGEDTLRCNTLALMPSGNDVGILFGSVFVLVFDTGQLLTNALARIMHRTKLDTPDSRRPELYSRRREDHRRPMHRTGHEVPMQVAFAPDWFLPIPARFEELDCLRFGTPALWPKFKVLH